MLRGIESVENVWRFYIDSRNVEGISGVRRCVRYERCTHTHTHIYTYNSRATGSKSEFGADLAWIEMEFNRALTMEELAGKKLRVQGTACAREKWIMGEEGEECGIRRCRLKFPFLSNKFFGFFFFAIKDCNVTFFFFFFFLRGRWTRWNEYFNAHKF